MLSPFLVPYLKNQDMEEEALRIRRQYLPGSKMLCTERCGEALAKAMGLTIQYLPLENQKIDSILFYIDDTINTKDKNAPKDDPPVVVSIPANTIVININSIRSVIRHLEIDLAVLPRLAGVEHRIMDCNWLDNAAKNDLNPHTEYVLTVKWLRTVSTDFGYWEKGMTSLPMVAYLIDDETTHDKVLSHFNLTLT